MDGDKDGVFAPGAPGRIGVRERAGDAPAALG
jgi:hypothetical protein